jgi:hypothetical protein
VENGHELPLWTAKELLQLAKLFSAAELRGELTEKMNQLWKEVLDRLGV